MKYLVLLFAFIPTVSLTAQDFDQWISTAESSYDEKKYEQSAEAYTSAFELSDGNARHYYNAACSWALTGDTLQSIQYLELSAKSGYKNRDWAEKDTDLRALHALSQWNEVINLMQQNKDLYEKDFNKPLQAQLENIYVRDQALRQLYPDAMEKFGQDSEEMQYFWSVVAKEDSINEQEVITIIDEYGWVGKNEVGGKANTALWLVIQHAPLEIQEQYLPLLKESVKKEQSSGSHLALLEDRIQMRHGKPQVYGSQIVPDPETGKNMVYEILEPEYVNQRRQSVGLGPIEEYVKRWDIEWTIQQKEKE
jgi:hypothetical protein